MLSEHIRHRLEQLNRGPLPAAAGQSRTQRAADQAIASEDKTATKKPLDFSAIENPRLAQAVAKLKSYEPQTLEEVAPGRIVSGPVGSCYRIDRPLQSIWPQSEKTVAAARDRIVNMNGARRELHDELVAFVDHFPSGIMFLDLETCGFSGSMVFLAGLLCEVDGELTLRQLLARNYAEEPAMLAALWQTAASNPVLATFNGKTFDWPVVHDRSTLHHQGRDMRYVKRAAGNSAETERREQSVTNGYPAAEYFVLERRDPRPNPVHFDLLHHSRRRWKQVLPNCKLQTLERFLCGRARQGDIPGSEIPAAYHEFVRSGDARQIGDILHHNALDLVTLLQVSLQMV